MAKPAPPPLSTTARTFLLVNLFGVPALAFITALVTGPVEGNPRAVVFTSVFTLALGVCIVAYNAWLTWRGKRAGGKRGGGWQPTVIAMALWTVGCALTVLLFGSFSPLTLALNFVAGPAFG